MKAGVAALCCLLLLYNFAQADDDAPVKVAKILSGDEIALQDGRVVRIAGIAAAAPEAKTFLESELTGQAVILRDAAPDRYGRVAATVTVEGRSVSVERALLEQGLAFVYPASAPKDSDGAELDALLATEHAARLAGRGYWSGHADTQAAHAEPLYGSYGFVAGTVTKAERVKNKLYLNFGEDWRSDFTIAIAARDLRAFKNAGLDPLSWQGKNLRVRGWVKRDFGPMITVTDPHQVEVLE